MNAAQTKMMLKSLPIDKSIMLVAKHGVGKSSVVKQVAIDEGIEFHDVRLSQCEVGDIKGLPFLDIENDRTRFLKPYWWPRDPNSKGILFFDELNRATKDVLQAVFEICLDRRLDGEKLPPGWRVVAAINGSDDYDVIELDHALLDRWFYIDFDPSVKEWLDWAAKSGIHPAIIDFIAQNQNLLDPPQGAMEPGQVYPSRRSWSQFHDSITALGLWDSPDDGYLTTVTKGWLGVTISTMFPKFLMNEYSRLRAEDVLDNFDKVKDKIERATSDIESVAALSRSIIGEINRREAASIEEKQQTAIKSFMQIIPKDVASQFWIELLQITKLKKIIMSWQKNDPGFAKFVVTIYSK